MVQNLTNFDDILKEDYLGPIRDQLNSRTLLLDRLRRNEEDVGGTYAYVPLRVGRNSGIGAREDGGTLPDPGKQKYEHAQFKCAHNYGRIKITGPTIKASRKDKYAFVRAVDSEIQGMVRDLRDDVNRQLFGDGTGELAEVTDTDPSGDTIEVDTNMYFQRGMLVDFVDPSGDGTPRGEPVKVVGRPNTNEVKFETDVDASVSTGDLIVRDGNWRNEMMGLGGIVNDDNPYQNLHVGNIDRDQDKNEFWNANVIDAGTGLSLSLMQQAFDKTESEAGQVSLILTTYEQRRNYLDLLQDNVRFTPAIELHGGYRALDYNGVPLTVDRHMPADMLFIDEDVIQLYRMSDFEWMELDGGVLKQVAGEDAYEATLFNYATLGSSACNNHTKLENLS